MFGSLYRQITDYAEAKAWTNWIRALDQRLLKFVVSSGGRRTIHEITRTRKTISISCVFVDRFSLESGNSRR
jgi:hypothetical protein